MLKILFIIWLLISVITFVLLMLTSELTVRKLKTKFPNATLKYRNTLLEKVVASIKLVVICCLPIIHLGLLLIILFKYDICEDAMEKSFCERYYLE